MEEVAEANKGRGAVAGDGAGDDGIASSCLLATRALRRAS